MKPKVTKELIFSYFMGNVSAMQRQMIAQWVREKANEEQLYVWLEEFEALHPEYEADLENAVRKYYTFLADLTETTGSDTRETAKENFQRKVNRNFWLKWGVAAGVALLLGATAFFNSDTWQFKTYSTQIGERKDFLLPDGSAVTLSTNSVLKIPRRGFGQESRDVYLTGEAFFDVTHAPDNQRFVVKTAKQFEVEVLGTEFNVVARETGSRVILRKGKVQLHLQSGTDNRQMALKPGDVFTLDSKNNTSLKTTTLSEIREAWQGHLYLFDKTSLAEIMNQLRQDQGIRVTFADPELRDHTLSGKFTAESLDELFELIQGLLDIQIIRQGNSVTISRPFR